MFPAAMAATFDRNVSHRGILALFQSLLGLATFFNDLSRSLMLAYAGREWRVVGGRLPEARRRGTVRPVRPPIYYGCQYVASRAVTRSDGVPRVSHVLIKDWHVFHVLSRLSADETWTPDSFGARLNIVCLLINLEKCG